MKEFFTLFVIIGCVLIFLSFVINTKDIVRDEKSDIVAVWKHRANEYSVTVQEGLKFVDIPFSGTKLNQELIADVPSHKKMWYEAHYRFNSWTGGGYEDVKIHIHSINEVNGAGWNHGKFGSGMTERVDVEKPE